MSDTDFTVSVLDENNQEVWTGPADDLIAANEDSLTPEDRERILALKPGDITPSLEGSYPVFSRRVTRPLVDPES